MLHPTTAAPSRGPEVPTRARGTSSRRAHRRGSRTVKDLVLGALALVGVASVIWLLATWALQLSVIVFVTGSMAPTMPTGAAAVVQRVDASQLSAGDVVTVPKPGSGVPVTHRIVEIAPAEGAEAERTLTLRGDANDIVDPVTYTVANAQRVLAAAPGVGWAVIWAKSPAAMVALTLAVGAAITWALWPERRRPAS